MAKFLKSDLVGEKGQLGTATVIGDDVGGSAEVTPASIVTATGQMTAAQAQQTRENIGAGADTEEITISSAGEVTQAIDPGKIYHFTGELIALTILFNAPANGQLPHYHIDFVSGSSAVPLTLPTGVVLPDGFTTDTNTRYEIDILSNYAVVASWEES